MHHTLAVTPAVLLAISVAGPATADSPPENNFHQPSTFGDCVTTDLADPSAGGSGPYNGSANPPADLLPGAPLADTQSEGNSYFESGQSCQGADD